MLVNDSLPSHGNGEGCQCHSSVGVLGCCKEHTPLATPSTIVHSLQIYSKLFKVVDKSEIVVPSNSGSINKDCGYCGNQRVGMQLGWSISSK